MNKELMERFAEEYNYGEWPFGNAPSCVMNKNESSFSDFCYEGGLFLDDEHWVFVCSKNEYENYTQQHNEQSPPSTVTEAFQMLQELAEQSNYDINITSVGTIIYDDAGDEIRGTPEQLYKILEAQINLRNLVKEVTGE